MPFTHYSCVIIILFNTGLCRSAFPTIFFRKLVFPVSVLSVFFVFESDVPNQGNKICLIMLRNFVMKFCSHFIKTQTTKSSLVSGNRPGEKIFITHPPA